MGNRPIDVRIMNMIGPCERAVKELIDRHWALSSNQQLKRKCEGNPAKPYQESCRPHLPASEIAHALGGW